MKMKKEISHSEKINYRGQLYLLGQLNPNDHSLTSWEKSVWKARLSSNSIIQYSATEALEILNRILISSCNISGLPMHDDKIFSEQLKKDLLNFFLEFGYKLLNEEEFLLAFKINAWGQAKFLDGTSIPQIEPTGKFINVMFCAKVLGNYMTVRSIFDRKMENIIDGYAKN